MSFACFSFSDGGRHRTTTCTLLPFSAESPVDEAAVEGADGPGCCDGSAALRGVAMIAELCGCVSNARSLGGSLCCSLCGVVVQQRSESVVGRCAWSSVAECADGERLGTLAVTVGSNGSAQKNRTDN